MPIVITARHMDATQQVQDYARKKAEWLQESFPGIEHVHVILDIEKRNCIAEIVVQGKNHIRAESAESAENMLAAMDAAVDKIERQLRKQRDKVRDHKPAMKHGELTRERGL